jgi:hypothetical protein
MTGEQFERITQGRRASLLTRCVVASREIHHSARFYVCDRIRPTELNVVSGRQASPRNGGGEGEGESKEADETAHENHDK